MLLHPFRPPPRSYVCALLLALAPSAGCDAGGDDTQGTDSTGSTASNSLDAQSPSAPPSEPSTSTSDAPASTSAPQASAPAADDEDTTGSTEPSQQDDTSPTPSTPTSESVLDAGSAGEPNGPTDAPRDAAVPTASTGEPSASTPEAGQQSPTGDTDPEQPETVDASSPDPASAPRLLDYQPLGEPIGLEGLDGATSDVTWMPESDTFFVLTDGSRTLYEFNADFTLRLRGVQLQNGPTDGEGISYLGGNRFAIASEDNTVVVFTLDPEATTLDVSSAELKSYVPAPPPSQVNKGFEGITFRPGSGEDGELIVCQEGDPGNVAIAVYSFLFSPNDAAEASYADGSLTVTEPFDAEAELGVLGADLTGMAYEARDDSLLITSHLAAALLKIDRVSGALLEQLPIERSPQYEGVALASDNRLVLLSEPNFVELWAAD